jgi:hypothetical protein
VGRVCAVGIDQEAVGVHGHGSVPEQRHPGADPGEPL